MAIYELDTIAPRLADSSWVADSAQIMGRVELCDDVRCGATLNGGRVRDRGPQSYAAWLHHW